MRGLMRRVAIMTAAAGAGVLSAGTAVAGASRRPPRHWGLLGCRGCVSAADEGIQLIEAGFELPAEGTRGGEAADRSWGRLAVGGSQDRHGLSQCSMLTSRLTTGQLTTNPLGPNGVPAGKPVARPSMTCLRAAEKLVWRTLRPPVTAASVHVARWMSHMGL